MQIFDPLQKEDNLVTEYETVKTKKSIHIVTSLYVKIGKSNGQGENICKIKKPKKKTTTKNLPQKIII